MAGLRLLAGGDQLHPSISIPSMALSKIEKPRQYTVSHDLISILCVKVVPSSTVS